MLNLCYSRKNNNKIIIIILPVKNKKHTRSYMLNDKQLQSIFITSLKKTGGCQMTGKKIRFENISMAGAGRCYLKLATRYL